MFYIKEMETENSFTKQHFFLQRIKQFLKMETYNTESEYIAESIKELCVAKLCDILGIGCGYNFRNEYFEVYASVLGEVICEKLELNIHVAKESIRFIRYEGINFIEKSRQILEREEINEAIVDIFNFVETNKKLII